MPDWVSGQLMMDFTGVSSIASEPPGLLAPGLADSRDRFGSVMAGSPPHTRYGLKGNIRVVSVFT